jgi:hypothetical protein
LAGPGGPARAPGGLEFPSAKICSHPMMKISPTDLAD